MSTFGTRTRVRGYLSNNGLDIRILAAGPSQNFNNYAGRPPPMGESLVMTDVVQPNFRARQANGEVIFNPMTSTRVSIKGGTVAPGATYINPGWAYGQRYWYTGADLLAYAIAGAQDYSLTLTTQMPAAFMPPSLCGASSTRVVAEASTKALRSPSSANSLVTLAELHKAKALFPGLLDNWTRVFRQLNSAGTRRRNLTSLQASKQAKRNLATLDKEVIEAYLAIRFGLRPLIMDTLGAIKAIQSALSGYGENNRHTTRGSASVANSSVRTGYFDNGAWRTSYTRADNHRMSVRATSLWEYKLDLARDLGFSISAIPEAAMDLVKFSFIVNWIVNINDYCSYLGTLGDPALSHLGGCYTLLDERSSVWQATGTTMTDPTFICDPQCGGIVSSSFVKKERVVGLRPGLVVRASPLAFLGDGRLLDAIALTRQQLRGRNVRRLRSLSASYGHF